MNDILYLVVQSQGCGARATKTLAYSFDSYLHANTQMLMLLYNENQMVRCANGIILYDGMYINLYDKHVLICTMLMFHAY